MNPRPTTPTDSRGHGGIPRGLEQTPSSATDVGRFGRMFRRVPVFEQRPESLVELGTAMIQELEEGKLDKPLGDDDDDENTAALDDELRLPAGYTYFGQFVDHDITFDPVSSLERQNDPNALTDFRTPRFDLDSVYGRGPADQPYLYEPDGVHLALGNSVSQDARFVGPDLQRGPSERAIAGAPGELPGKADAGERAIIGDPRNDENLIVSQLQVAFLLIHNRVIDKVHEDRPDLKEPADVFKLAQQQVRWHYQWVVIHDYLRRLVGQETIDDILRPEPYVDPAGPQTVLRERLLFYEWRKSPFMPVEFSVAAYRFGHSIARPSYLINDLIPVPVVDNASRIPLFSQDGDPTQHLNGFRTLPTDWGVQWKYLLSHTNDVAGDRDQHLPQPSYKLDAQLSNPLGALPAAVAGPEDIVAGEAPEKAQNLAVRNLLRGLRMGLPSGQDVARAMGIEPLADEQLFDGVELSTETKDDLSGAAPLWFYVLKEAQVLADSAHLGPVGGRIIAEVLIGLLAGDPLSYVSVNPTWKPTLPARSDGTFTLSDIVNFAKPAPEGPPPAPVYQP